MHFARRRVRVGLACLSPATGQGMDAIDVLAEDDQLADLHDAPHRGDQLLGQLGRGGVGTDPQRYRASLPCQDTSPAAAGSWHASSSVRPGWRAPKPGRFLVMVTIEPDTADPARETTIWNND
ncbi:hypothetical protein GCM10022267_53750 [Lentzea roselyniae]|uniref:Uncharacterized protein n=1 Tax=Lentzea roselyniae TaxID=531940 RepID=A0ABP7BJ27_9PSEU